MSAERDLHDALAAWVAERFPGGRLLRTWSLKGGVSSKMTAFEAATAVGPTRFVLRQLQSETGAGQPADVRREHRLLTWLEDSGACTPEVYALDLFGERFGRPGLILEYVDGEPDYNPADRIEFGRAFAGGLYHAHWHGQAQNGLDFLPEIAGRAERILSHVEREASLGSDEAHWASVLRGRFPIEERNPPTLLHADYWPGNVLWNDGRLAAIVDWEEAAWGDPLADLAIARLDLLWMAGEEAVEAFTARYVELTDADLTRLPEWDLVAALRPYGYLDLWSSTWPANGRPDITARTMAVALRAFAERAVTALS
jgi:aminoglycoside phosphotransferase (APT) family kinase protein